MRKIEKTLLALQIVVIGTTLLSHVVSNATGSEDALKVEPMWYMIAFAAGAICCAIKLYLIRNDQNNDKVWTYFRLLDLFMMAMYVAVYSFQSLFAIVFPYGIVISQYSPHHNRSDTFARLSIIILFINLLVRSIFDTFSLFDLSQFIIILAVIFSTSKLTLKILATQKGNVDQLSVANDKLNRKVAEFFNLQHLQSAIKSIHNTDELLMTVNDMIIGIVGPTYSSIVLHKKDKVEAFELAATNIRESDQEDFMEHDCPILWSIMKEDGIVGDVGEDMSFKNEKIASYMIVPLTIKNEPTGMIVVTQYLRSGLNYEHLRLIRFVAADLSIALENTGLYEKMEKMATIDGLTMVYNRMYFKNALENEFAKAKDNYPLSIAICDADFFKKVNDKFGHIFGDYVLKSIADRLKHSIRSNDIIARYGGEEFVIILPNCSSQVAYKIVDRLRATIGKEPIKDKNHSTNLTVSFGVATYPDNGETSTEVLRAADNALYEAKRAGRNCTREA
ncbi:MAG TPA: diguanylate cyclase [Bacillota bacterium]|nr:diguanylate cyclase [Bacillota bacterium]